MSHFMLNYEQGTWVGLFTHFASHGVKHGVSTRIGGVSTGPFDSLNLALHVGDDPDNVRTNRLRFCHAVGVDPGRIVTAQQVHADQVYAVTREHSGSGAFCYEESLEGTDALITDIPGIPLMLFFADCVPVLVFDPVHRAIGISHAGWKGTVAKIGQKTVMAMHKRFGTNPGTCLVGIGPSIGPCCYEVDQPVIDRVYEAFGSTNGLVQHDHSGSRHLDLWMANKVQLEEIGVRHENIAVTGVCTSCNTPLFYSYRAEGSRTGRIGAVISL